MGVRLGLDLGTNSIGWAVLETDGIVPSNIVKAGVRISEAALLFWFGNKGAPGGGADNAEESLSR